MQNHNTEQPGSNPAAQHDTAMQGENKAKAVTGRRKVIDRREADVPQGVENERRSQVERRAGHQTVSSESNTKQSGAQTKQREHDESDAHQLAAMRRLLATCERVNSANYHSLVMEGFPTNFELFQAQRLRDVFVICGSACLAVFIIGAGGLINAWVAAAAAGLAALSFILAFTPLQSVVTNRPSMAELRGRQSRLVMTALSHVRFLEGADGLAWRCLPLGEYNGQLYSNQFARLAAMSKAGTLTRVMRSKNHFRLYLMFVLEAQKAYQRLQKAYLNNHFAVMESNPERSSSSA